MNVEKREEKEKRNLTTFIWIQLRCRVDFFANYLDKQSPSLLTKYTYKKKEARKQDFTVSAVKKYQL